MLLAAAAFYSSSEFQKMQIPFVRLEASSPHPSLEGGVALVATTSNLDLILRETLDILYLAVITVVRAAPTHLKISLGLPIHLCANAIDQLIHRVEELGVDFNYSDAVADSIQTSTNRVTLSSSLDLVKNLQGKVSRLKTRAIESDSYGISDLPTQLAYESLLRSLVAFDQVFDFANEETTSAAAKTLPTYGSTNFSPGRDHFFEIVEAYTRQARRSVSPHESLREVLHNFIMGTEIPTMETCASCIFDFPEMPFSFVKDMARQLWDEARHAQIFLSHLQKLGGKLGEYPIDMRLWKMISGEPLACRLMIHQRIGEWLGVDAVFAGKRASRRDGDEATAMLMDFVMLDEITHVRFGNKWINFLLKNPSDIEAVRIRAEEIRIQAGAAINGRQPYPVHEWACKRASFKADEVKSLVSRRASTR